MVLLADPPEAIEVELGTNVGDDRVVVELRRREARLRQLVAAGDAQASASAETEPAAVTETRRDLDQLRLP